MLKPMGIFHTPKDWDELMLWIESSASCDKTMLLTAAGMAWNLATKDSSELVKEIEDLCDDCDGDTYLQAEIGGAGSVTYAIRKILKGGEVNV